MRDTELGFRLCLLEISIELPAGAVRDGGGDLLLPSPSPWRATMTQTSIREHVQTGTFSQPCNEMTTLPIRASFSM